MLDRYQVTHCGEVITPAAINRCFAQQLLHVVAAPGTNRLEMRHGFAPADDREMRAVMLDCIEQIRKVPSRVGRTDF